MNKSNKKRCITKEEFDRLERRVSVIENGLPSDDPDTSTSMRDVSPREIFLRYKLAKSGIDKCLVVLFVLDNEKKDNGFNLSNIQSAFQDAKEKPPKNLSDAVSTLGKKGYIATRSGEGKSRMYYLTNSGIEYLNTLKEAYEDI